MGRFGAVAQAQAAVPILWRSESVARNQPSSRFELVRPGDARLHAAKPAPPPTRGPYRSSLRSPGFDRSLTAAAFSTRETNPAAVSSPRLRAALRATDSTSESRPSLAQ